MQSFYKNLYNMQKIFLCTLCTFFFLNNSYCQKDSVSNKQNTAIVISGKVYEKVEIEAAFPGGVDAWRLYLQQNLKANVPVKKGAPAGTYQVIVRFIVSTDGQITDVEAETDYGYGMEKEVIRIIKKGPKWLPAMQNGRNVNAYRRQPITFLVTNEK